MNSYERVEKSVLSMIIQNPEVYLARCLGDMIGVDHFYETTNKIVFNRILQQKKDGKPIELVSLTELMLKNGELEKIGGPQNLTEIYTYSPTAAHYSYHIEMLREQHARRIAIEALQVDEREIQDMSPCQLSNHLRKASESVSEASLNTNGDKDAKTACKKFVHEFENLLENKTEIGTKTGLRELDNVTNGMRAGELWVIAAPTSGGKSVMALQLALSCIMQDKRAGIFSLEMGAEENISRMISCHGGVDYSEIRKPSNLTKDSIRKIQRSVKGLASKNFIICDEAGMTIDRITSTAQRWDDVDKVSVLVVDYVQLIQDEHRKGERTDEKLCRISGMLKQLAKKLKCCVITASQLNQEGRMAQASGILNDADVGLRIEGEKGLYVLKNRNGEKDMHLNLHMEGKHQKFIERRIQRN